MTEAKKLGGGTSKARPWAGRSCSSCGKDIAKAADSSRLRSIWWVDGARHSGYVWVHRAHLFASGGK